MKTRTLHVIMAIALIAPASTILPSAHAEGQCIEAGLTGGAYQDPVAACASTSTEYFWGDKWTCVDDGTKYCASGTCIATKTGNEPKGVACVDEYAGTYRVCLGDQVKPANRHKCPSADSNRPRDPRIPPLDPRDVTWAIQYIIDLVESLDPCKTTDCNPCGSGPCHPCALRDCPKVKVDRRTM